LNINRSIIQLVDWRNIVSNIAYTDNDINNLEAIKDVNYPIVPARCAYKYRDNKK